MRNVYGRDVAYLEVQRMMWKQHPRPPVLGIATALPPLLVSRVRSAHGGAPLQHGITPTVTGRPAREDAGEHQRPWLQAGHSSPWRTSAYFPGPPLRGHSSAARPPRRSAGIFLSLFFLPHPLLDPCQPIVNFTLYLQVGIASPSTGTAVAR